MARINPDKLVTNFRARSSKFGQLEAFWNIPTAFVDGEEIVVARRKDAFPVEIRNRNYEDRYTDVVQVEVFRGAPIYCSHLLVNENTLVVAGDNTFSPANVSEFERDSKLSGRLIRDSRGQVFRIVTNTNDTIVFESTSSNPINQATPAEGPFVILADFPKEARALQTLSTIANSNTIRVVSNSFMVGDKITINNTVDLNYGTEWTSGATVEETARNIAAAIVASGVLYTAEAYGHTVLVERNTEPTLAVVSNTMSLVVRNYGASEGLIFISNNTLSPNSIRHLSIQDGNAQPHFVRANNGKVIYLYDDALIPLADFSILPSFNNSFPSPFVDNYRSFLDALTKRGSGLEPDTFYYYTAFNSPITSYNVMSNEVTDGGEELTPYTVDKVSNYYTRVFYESIKYLNPVGATFSYVDATGVITYQGAPDLSVYGIQVGDLFADSKGLRYTIISVANAAIGQISVAPLSDVDSDIRNQIHGCITRALVPANFNDVQVNDTFKDLAGNSFPIKGTPTEPLAGLSTPPGHSFDVLQGLVDELVELNTFLLPFTYNPTDGKIQYGEEYTARNLLLSGFTYNSVSGVVQYTTSIDLSAVEVGDYFIDGAGNKFSIVGVNAALEQVTLDDLLTVNTTVATRRDGAIVRVTPFVDAEGNLLINLSNVVKFDLFRTNSKSVYSITKATPSQASLLIEPNLDSVSTNVVSEFDASIIRRGSEVAWIGFNNEFVPTLVDIAQGGVKRYNSVTNAAYALFSTPLSTQAFAIHAADRKFGELLYNSFPNIFRVTDTSNDLQDLMEVFGHEFNDLYAIITKYELQNADIVTPGVLATASQNSGFSLTAENLGIDTRRRVMRDLISCYKLKGNRDGIARFIKVLTTWDITNGTGDTRSAIIDDTPDTVGLRFYSPSLGALNTRIVDTLNVESPPAGRFYRGIPGLSLPGFFSAKEVIIDLPNVALEIGNSTNLAFFEGNTILTDSNANFRNDNSLIGCFVIPNEGSPNDFYEITGNTSTSLTLTGGVPLSSLGAKYVIVSPLNLTRFVALGKELPKFMPYDTVAIFNFTIQTI